MLHLTNGDSAVPGIEATGVGGDVVPWRDTLHEGPLPAGVDAAELRAVRARFLAGCGWGEPEAIEADMRARDERLATALERDEVVVLWFEHDLYDQLQLMQVLSRANEGVELIQAPDHLGPLGPEELETLWPKRRPVTARMLELAREAWDAFRAPEPTALAALLERDTSALPFLAAALRRLLEELPDAESGLSRTERQLLESLLDGPRRPPELFVASQAREEAAFAGDAWIWKRLAELVPLVEELPPAPPLGDARTFAATAVTLTTLGRDVLAGRADRVQAAPLDRWVGGIQLGSGPDWRWDAAGTVRAA